MRGSWVTKAVMAVACCVTVVGVAQDGVSKVRDPLFPGAEKFARNARSVVQVDEGPVTLERAEGRYSERHHGASNVYVFKYDRDGAYDPAEVKPYEDRIAADGWSCETIPSKRRPGAYRYKCRKPLADGYHDAVDILVEARQLVFTHSINNHEEYDSGDW
ncbi:hypothetical protein GOB94_02455 [Granulicella sp. 5B5]|uniref:hypothetical protein n=1 Tax=Granulicella sp. 5B5 TaxID=1617967 RepID=UPI0015F5FB5B|nr:hypothetical protein [Granulicella sp. 5B5]QMV17689.1 hypothetical protein GOB94_02455 [Granulicella sp. 5B5]